MNPLLHWGNKGIIGGFHFLDPLGGLGRDCMRRKGDLSASSGTSGVPSWTRAQMLRRWAVSCLRLMDRKGIISKFANDRICP